MVLGSSGVVGTHMADMLEKNNEVIRVARGSKHADLRLDLSIEDNLEEVLLERPEIIINAVKPPVSVDEMEAHPESAYNLNVVLAQNLAKKQKEFGYLLVHISSDGVYPGGKDKVYNEDDLLYPLNYYSYTKAIAEERIRCNTPEHIILRTEGVFGYDERGTNFFMRMHKMAEEENTFYATSDQMSQPICGIELSKLAERLISIKKRGTYNACGVDYISRYELANRIKKTMHWNLEIKKSSINERNIKVQQELKIDVSKIQKDAGKISNIETQIEELKSWFYENKII